MYKPYSIFLLSLAFSLMNGCGGSSSGGSTPQTDLVALKIDLGEKIFNDTDLSNNGNQSCASCHDESTAFADPVVTNTSPVSEGSDANTFGNRNAPTAMYASFIPDFNFNTSENKYFGGQFIDGRATDLVEQAKGPFLNPLEMNNTDKADVIQKISNASYASQFEEVYGNGSLNDVNAAYEQVADAIAAFESTSKFAPFTSKFDYVQSGAATFTASEARGLAIFEDTETKCSECHTMTATKVRSMFTDFSYSNIGAPTNSPANLNNLPDLGLGDSNRIPALSTQASLEEGKFRVPTLRNVELTAPYFHNGAVSTLEEVIDFYENRTINACGSSVLPSTTPITCWPDPEVSSNLDDRVPTTKVFSTQDKADLLAFLKTLTDDYTP